MGQQHSMHTIIYVYHSSEIDVFYASLVSVIYGKSSSVCPQVSQTRLEARSHRPDVELCRDPVYHRLVEEVGQIQESVDLLHRKLGEAEQAHQDLLVNKARLEHDLKVKSNSLFIDREKCLSARKSFPVISLATKL